MEPSAQQHVREAAPAVDGSSVPLAAVRRPVLVQEIRKQPAAGTDDEDAQRRETVDAKDKAEDEEVETVVEEVRGLSSLRIKPRVVISDKKKKAPHPPASAVVSSGSAASSSSSSGLIINRGRLCSVCAAHFGCYTCPRCNAASCSLACYKAHSVKCTEAFYKENVEEELKAFKAEEADREKMLQLLKRMKDQEDEEEEDEHEAELYYKLAQLSTDDNLSLEQLTPEQREDFFKSLVDGRISDAIPLWNPWWFQNSVELVAPLRKEDNESDDEDELRLQEKPKPPPAIISDIPALSTLISKEPSPLLVFHLVDIVFSYAYVMRFFNGEPESEASDAVSFLAEISAVLQTSTVHASLESALDTCLTNIRKPTVSGSSAFGLAVVDDMKRILGEKRFVLMALCDLHALVSKAANEVLSQPGHLAKRETKRLHSKLTAMEKKVYFFIAWANEQSSALYMSTAALVEMYLKEKHEARGTSPTSTIGYDGIKLPTAV